MTRQYNTIFYNTVECDTKKIQKNTNTFTSYSNTIELIKHSISYIISRCTNKDIKLTMQPHAFIRSTTTSPATAGIANRPLLFLEQRIPMPELFTVRRFTRVLEAGKYGCPY